MVPTLTFGEEEGFLCLAMAHVEGSDLRELLREEGALEPGRALRLLAQVAGALDAAHAAGLVHRDVEPATFSSLPRHHIHWYADAPSTKLKEIDFLIDGKLRWIQHKPFYIYGDLNDDLGEVDRGYLLSSWLTPGLHRFGALATATDGRIATDT